MRPSGPLPPPLTTVPAQPASSVPAAPVELPAFLNELLQAGAIKLPGATPNDGNLQSWQGRNVASQNTRLRSGVNAAASNFPQVIDPFCFTERGWCCRSYNFGRDSLDGYGCAGHKALFSCHCKPVILNVLASQGSQFPFSSAMLGALSCGLQR